jgi:hypothetical protein
LSGYRPAELLLGRLLALEGFGVCIAGLFGAVMIAGTGGALFAAAAYTGALLIAALALQARRVGSRRAG